MSSMMGAKAIGLVHRGEITESSHARVFNAEGSGGQTYTVTIVDGADLCTCQAGKNGRSCYHARAAHLLMARDRDA